MGVVVGSLVVFEGSVVVFLVVEVGMGVVHVSRVFGEVYTAQVVVFVVLLVRVEVVVVVVVFVVLLAAAVVVFVFLLHI